MPEIELLCLANSRKYAGRCVAGLTTEHRWLRPVSAEPNGKLTERMYCYDDGAEAALLDVIALSLEEPAPLPYQPENWLLGTKRWRRATRVPAKHFLPIARRLLVAGPELLGSCGGIVQVERFDAEGACASLALVEPETLSWEVRENLRGWPQVRARFTLSGSPYDLSVTDPRFEKEAAALGFGIHARDAVASVRGRRILMTVSLGEPLEGRCYKLVAAVIAVPA